FGVGGKCFPDTILKLAASRPALDVVNDQRGSPTYAEDLARAIIQLCRKNATGIVHATNAGDCSWFEFAEEIVSRVGLGTTVRPVSSQQMARPAPRPAYSVLSPVRLRALGIEMPSWRDALRRYLEQRQLTS
ncbi:MAG: sugar nucleotide-binding protein, partial [Candidatus Sulfotelmatobacter sp.]